MTVQITYERTWHVSSADALDDYPPTAQAKCASVDEVCAFVRIALEREPKRKLMIEAIDHEVAPTG